MNILSYIILVLMGVSFCLTCGNAQWKLPFLVIANRWFRWILFSLLITYFVRQWDLSEQPFFVLILTFFLIWFLGESILIWVNIRALNRSSIAFFPRFTVDHVETKWPNLKRFIQLKEFLRSNGFKETQSIKTTVVGSLVLHSLVYKDLTSKILLQLLFFPQKNGISNVYYTLTSLSSDGKRYITDNLDMPFGGYMPNNWFKVKKPLCDSLGNLLKYHFRRLNTSGKDFVIWDGAPLNEINHQQSVLEYYNIKKGFLNPPNFHEDYGKLTSEGCYRLWKQFLFLKYVGVSLD
jgi:hypothetical protein